MTSAEIEGAWAGLCWNRHINSCPYRPGDPNRWLWQSAFDIALTELCTIRVGMQHYPQALREAIGTGALKFKYANPRFIEAYREGAIS